MTLSFIQSHSNKFNPDAPKANTFTFRTFGRSSTKLSAIKARGGIKLAIKTDGEALVSTMFDPPSPSTSTAPTSFPTPPRAPHAATSIPCFDPIIPANASTGASNDITVSPTTASQKMQLQVTPPTPPRGAAAGRRASDRIPVGPCAEWGGQTGRRVFPKNAAKRGEQTGEMEESKEISKVRVQDGDREIIKRKEETEEDRKKRLEALIHALDDLEGISINEPEDSSSSPIIHAPHISAFTSDISHDGLDGQEEPLSYASHPMSRTYAASCHPRSQYDASPTLSAGSDSPVLLSYSIESSPALSATSSHSDDDSPSSSAFPSPDLNYAHPHLPHSLHDDHQYGTSTPCAISMGDNDHDENETAAADHAHQEWQARWAGVGTRKSGRATKTGGLGLGFMGTDAGDGGREEQQEVSDQERGQRKKMTMTVGRAGGQRIKLGWI